MLNRLSVNALLKSVIVLMATAIIVMLAMGAWDSWRRLQAVNRITVAAAASSHIFKALHNIAHRLKTLGISYAVVDGMALFRLGFRRFTEDMDILVTKEDLKRIHEELEGLGYLSPFPNSTETTGACVTTRSGRESPFRSATAAGAV